MAFEIQPRVLHGEIAQPGQFPYFVDLEIYTSTEYHPKLKQKRAMCGAVLISDKWILTAGIVVNESSSLVCRIVFFFCSFVIFVNSSCS